MLDMKNKIEDQKKERGKESKRQNVYFLMIACMQIKSVPIVFFLCCSPFYFYIFTHAWVKQFQN
jgi:hypothetical protein